VRGLIVKCAIGFGRFWREFKRINENVRKGLLFLMFSIIIIGRVFLGRALLEVHTS
jgi:hypothetical protein